MASKPKTVATERRSRVGGRGQSTSRELVVAEPPAAEASAVVVPTSDSTQGQTPVTRRKPEPLEEMPMVFERAQHLATAPRSRVNTLATAAIWTGVALIPGLIDGLVDAFAEASTGNLLIAFTQIGIFCGCVVAAAIGLSQTHDVKTSDQLLNEFYKRPVPPPRRGLFGWSWGRWPWT